VEDEGFHVDCPHIWAGQPQQVSSSTILQLDLGRACHALFKPYTLSMCRVSQAPGWRHGKISCPPRARAGYFGNAVA